MILPLVVGCGVGAACVAVMYRLGMLEERSGTAVLVAAIAVFYPVFAIASAAGWPVIVFHLFICAAFLGAAAWGFQTGTLALAGLLVLHGVFDAIAAVVHAPGPEWWPAFCAGVDIVAGLALFWLVRRKGIPA